MVFDKFKNIFIVHTAALSACKAEEQRLKQENDKLKDTVRYLKDRLVEAEIRNGGKYPWHVFSKSLKIAKRKIQLNNALWVNLVPQVSLPVKGSVKTEPQQSATPVVPKVEPAAQSPAEPPVKQAKKKEKKGAT